MDRFRIFTIVLLGGVVIAGQAASQDATILALSSTDTNVETGIDSGGTDTCPPVAEEEEDAHALADEKDPPPPDIPGWLGRRDVHTPTRCGTQIWDDTDGIDVETPGCHIEYESNRNGVCQNPTGIVFGESCDDDGDTLVETNPQAGLCHHHKNGIGRPDLFSCDTYCQRKYGLMGRCMGTVNTCGNGVDSAYCLCGD